jgi:hypothetical protein
MIPRSKFFFAYWSLGRYVILIVTFDIYLLILVRKIFYTTLLFDQIFIISIVTFIGTVSLRFVFSREKNFKIQPQKLATIGILSALIFYTFGTAVLLNVDRSRSLYIFQWVDECKNSMACLTKYTEENYGVRGSAEIIQRIHEQSKRGLMDVNGNSIYLTFMGKIVKFSAHLSAVVFNLKGYFNAKL